VSLKTCMCTLCVVFGCADETSAMIKGNARMSRQGDITTITCLTTDKMSTLTCINDTWRGEHAHCNEVGRLHLEDTVFIGMKEVG